jgi:hypothetical protein
MAKRKVGLTIEDEIMRQARQRSIGERTSVSQICEDFLKLWLDSDKTAAELLVKLKEILDGEV